MKVFVTKMPALRRVSWRKYDLSGLIKFHALAWKAIKSNCPEWVICRLLAVTNSLG